MHGDCLTCVYHDSIDNSLPCREYVYGRVCKIMKGDREELFQILPVTIKYGVDATPDREYPIRITRPQTGYIKSKKANNTRLSYAP